MIVKLKNNKFNTILEKNSKFQLNYKIIMKILKMNKKSELSNQS